MANFAERFFKLREDKNASYPEISREIGVSIRALKYYGSGERDPSMSVLTSLANYFQVPMDYLTGAGIYGQIEGDPVIRDSLAAKLDELLGKELLKKLGVQSAAGLDDVALGELATAVVERVSRDAESGEVTIQLKDFTKGTGV